MPQKRAPQSSAAEAGKPARSEKTSWSDDADLVRSVLGARNRPFQAADTRVGHAFKHLKEGGAATFVQRLVAPALDRHT